MRSPEALPPKNAALAEAVERNRTHPLQPKRAAPAAHPESDPHPNTADLPAHPRQSGRPPAGPLVEGARFRAVADSL